jgi:BirA family biotin operon repressor/biotin-[acetyl-CoA-carboxylase] ligase
MNHKSLSWIKDYHIIMFDQIDSTNLECMRMAKSGLAGNFIVWSKSQTNGRGQNGRNWDSKDGNLYFSILTNSCQDIKSAPQLSFVASLALFDTIVDLFKKHQIKNKCIELKWPNDLLINGQKCAGILLESVYTEKLGLSVVIGIGLNILHNPIIQNKQITNLHKHGLIGVDILEVLSCFMHYFTKLYNNWYINGFDGIKDRWLTHAYKLNQKVQFVENLNNSQSKEYVFHTISQDGAIILQDLSYQELKFYAGEVSLS